MNLEKFNLPRTVIETLSHLEPTQKGLVYAALMDFIYNDDESAADNLSGDALNFYNEAKSLINKQVRRARAYRKRKEEIAAGLRPAPVRKPKATKNAEPIYPLQRGNLMYGEDGWPIPMDTDRTFWPDAPYYKNIHGFIIVYPQWPRRTPMVYISPIGQTWTE